MYVEQIYTNCLAEASYYVESNGEAIIIDPIREPEPYIALAQKRNATIKYILETHFHADFVSGHIDLAKRTQATIVYGPTAKPNYTVYEAKDGEVLTIGDVSITILHTPGHTPESTCFLLKDENGKDYAVFTGDTLFVGDVGRPDLLDGVMTKEELAGMLYTSLNTKIKPLADEVIVYPAHGPGSACGKNIGKETFSTIGTQKKTNYALQEMTKEEFISKITDGLTPPPAYFFMDAKINKNGYEDLETVLTKNKRSLTASETKNLLAEGVLVLDTRNVNTFEKGFIKGAINVGLDGTYAVWVGTVIPTDTQLIIVAEQGKEHEAILRLARVGYEKIVGYVEADVEAWKNVGLEIDTITSVNADEFVNLYKANPKLNVLDVRKKGEFSTAHLPEVQHICLSHIGREYNKVSTQETVYVHCAGGYRSMIAASILKTKGITNIVNVRGGFGAISKLGVPVTTEEGVSC